jgi:hypothetical protein
MGFAETFPVVMTQKQRNLSKIAREINVLAIYHPYQSREKG